MLASYFALAGSRSSPSTYPRQRERAGLKTPSAEQALPILDVSKMMLRPSACIRSQRDGRTLVDNWSAAHIMTA